MSALQKYCGIMFGVTEMIVIADHFIIMIG
jgi:hypothetical protein